MGKTPGHHPIPQARINEILVEHARLGRDVVRLKGGDPFVLGRGGEEAIHCAANGIPVEVVPGVTSAVSVPAAAGIPVTHRGITASFVVASAHDGATAALDALRDAPVTSTVVLLMGVTALADTARRLVESGRPPTTPVALDRVRLDPRPADDGDDAGRRGRGRASAKGVRSPAVVVVGEVVRIREQVGDLVPPSLLADAAPSLVLLAHGSPDPRHAAGVEKVAEQVRRRWPGHVHAAYLDHHPPSATEVAKRLDGGVLVPLLLTTAYHVKTDVPEAAAAMDAARPGPLRGGRVRSVRTPCCSPRPTSCWLARASGPTRIPAWCSSPADRRTATPSARSAMRSPNRSSPAGAPGPWRHWRVATTWRRSRTACGPREPSGCWS